MRKRLPRIPPEPRRRSLWEQTRARKPTATTRGRGWQRRHQGWQEHQSAAASPALSPSLCQARATLTAHQRGWTFFPPLPRTSGRQGTYHSAKPRKKQAALTVSMCVRRPLINSFFPCSHLLCSGPLNPIQQRSELVPKLRHICQIPD